jgi:hypothetical protein
MAQVIPMHALTVLENSNQLEFSGTVCAPESFVHSRETPWDPASA